mmetsp:Transcript_47169/g.123756  ORF Transcript_47169/g.123756 Transcript_47169/m.123756 type:complete len:250 (-) Transcript_47169:527-1276(-)
MRVLPEEGAETHAARGAEVIQMHPQVGAILHAPLDRQRLMLCAHVALQKVVLTHARPEDRTAELRLHVDAEPVEPSATALLDICKVDVEGVETHPLRGPVRCLLVVVLPVKLPGLVLQDLHVLGIVERQLCDVHHSFGHCLDDVMRCAAVGVIAPALRRGAYGGDLVASHRALEAVLAPPDELLRLLRRDHVLKLQYERVRRERLRRVLWEVVESAPEHGAHVAPGRMAGRNRASSTTRAFGFAHAARH